MTREAQGYLPPVRAAFEDLREATARLQRPGRDELLVVSTTASLAAKWLVTRMAAFQDAHPGIEVRVTTSAHLVDFRREQVDMAVRYGRGNWPGLRAHWLMAEDIFPVCSPALLHAEKPLRRPEDLAHHTLLHATVSREDWQLWLTAAGLPVALAARRGLTFDQSFMATQAAMDGLGVALGRTAYVEADIAAGRLVVPFDVVLPADAGFYVVAPEDTADTPKIAQFRDWLIGSVAPGAVAPPPDLPLGSLPLRGAERRDRLDTAAWACRARSQAACASTPGTPDLNITCAMAEVIRSAADRPYAGPCGRARQRRRRRAR